MAERIAVVGSGYVGSVVAASLARIGHEVVAVERDPDRRAALRAGRAPFHEPGLDDLLERGLADRRLSFTDDLTGAMAGRGLVFVCVGTSIGRSGRPEVSGIVELADRLAGSAQDGQVLVVKSTVPVGTARWMEARLWERRRAVHDGLSVAVISNPEFLREGHGVEDFLHPDRIVVGGSDPVALRRVVEVYAPIIERRLPGEAVGGAPVPVIETDLVTSEVIKHAANAFLATKISFANEVGRICELVGADASVVAEGVGLDARIGPGLLVPGLGFGGSCLGKDLSALLATAADHGHSSKLLEAVAAGNDRQRQHLVDLLERELGRLDGLRIGLLGLAFKAGTDDIRDSPGLDVARRLIERGAVVTAYDPLVQALPDGGAVQLAKDALEAARGAGALVVATEGPGRTVADLSALRAVMVGDLLLDGRGCVDPARARAAGLRYVSLTSGSRRQRWGRRELVMP